MDQTLAQGYVSESIKSIAFFTILALCFNLYVKARNFFFIPYPLIKNKRQYPSFYHVAICFGIYLGFSAVIAPVATLFIRWFRSSFLGQTTMSLPLLSGLQLSTTLMILTTLFIFIRKQSWIGK